MHGYGLEALGIGNADHGIPIDEHGRAAYVLPAWLDRGAVMWIESSGALTLSVPAESGSQSITTVGSYQ